MLRKLVYNPQIFPGAILSRKMCLVSEKRERRICIYLLGAIDVESESASYFVLAHAIAENSSFSFLPLSRQQQQISALASFFLYTRVYYYYIYIMCVYVWLETVGIEFIANPFEPHPEISSSRGDEAVCHFIFIITC